MGTITSGRDNIHETFGGTPVEVGEHEKGLYDFDTPGGVPFLDGFNPTRVHIDVVVPDYESQVRGCLGVQFAYLWLEQDIVSTQCC